MEVKFYEPKLALVAGVKGIEYQEKLIAEASNYLKRNGFIIFEMGYNQSADIIKLAQTYHWHIKLYRDLQNYERLALIWKREDI